jgi:hypothetical protein
MLRLWIDSNKALQFERDEVPLYPPYANRVPVYFRHTNQGLDRDIQDGQHVVLYEPDEYEVEAVLKFDHQFNDWIAYPEWSTIKYYSSD